MQVHRSSHWFSLGCVIAALLAAGDAHWSTAFAQQATVRSPFQTNSSSFYEVNSVAWSGNYRGITFSFGNPALSPPAYGGYDPIEGLKTNFAFTGPNGRINFALNFSQGFKASSINNTPEVTMMNGQTGYISDTSQTPFVVSVIPVVGGFPMAAQPGVALPQTTLDPRIAAMLQARLDAQNADGGQANGQPPANAQQPGNAQGNGPQGNGPQGNVPPGGAQGNPADLNLNGPGAGQQNFNGANVQDAAAQDPAVARGVQVAQDIVASQESSAGRAAPSVAEARRMHEQEAAANAEDYAALLEKGKGLEEDGKPGVAKIYYQRVARHASGDLRQEALSRLEALKGSVSH